jgi:hypothetical protein
MQAKCFAIRFVVPQHGLFKVTISKEIVNQVWQRKYNEFFPACFLHMGEMDRSEGSP